MGCMALSRGSEGQADWPTLPAAYSEVHSAGALHGHQGGRCLWRGAAAHYRARMDRRRRGVFYRRADGERETKKRKPAVPLPPELHDHLRRWKRRGQRFAVEWYGEPVTSISKGFRAVVKDAGLGPDVTPHVLRHTAATWLMQAGTDPWEAAGFLGMTVETLMGRYGHHHPDYLSGARGAFSRHRNRHRNAATEREQTETNVTKIADFSNAGG